MFGRKVAYARELGLFYVSVAQAVLLFGSETCVMSLCIGRYLGGFHHRVARRLKGYQPWRLLDETWVCPQLTEAMS